MNIDNLPSGARVAVDANIIIYHFTGTSKQCSFFLERARRGELAAYIPTHIALELLHRLMMLEAVADGHIQSGSPAKKMSSKPELVRSLQRSYRDFRLLDRLGIRILSTSASALARVSWYSMNYGLLANDAALLAVMEEENLRHLVSCDSQLRDISPFQTWLPDDL